MKLNYYQIESISRTNLTNLSKKIKLIKSIINFNNITYNYNF